MRFRGRSGYDIMECDIMGAWDYMFLFMVIQIEVIQIEDSGIKSLPWLFKRLYFIECHGNVTEIHGIYWDI